MSSRREMGAGFGPLEPVRRLLLTDRLGLERIGPCGATRRRPGRLAPGRAPRHPAAPPLGPLGPGDRERCTLPPMQRAQRGQPHTHLPRHKLRRPLPIPAPRRRAQSRSRAGPHTSGSCIPIRRRPRLRRSLRRSRGPRTRYAGSRCRASCRRARGGTHVTTSTAGRLCGR